MYQFPYIPQEKMLYQIKFPCTLATHLLYLVSLYVLLAVLNIKINLPLQGSLYP